MDKSRLVTAFLAAALLSGLCTAALGQTQVPLNTGYDHANSGPYATVTSSPSPTPDNYWINIASYPPTLPPAPASSWVLQNPGPPWFADIASTHWISGRPTVGSPGTFSDPAYTIFRKCFCMLQAYTQPSLSFTVRADDTVQVWFNTQLNVVLAPTAGHYNLNVLTSSPSNPNWFRPGRNCIYVLVENYTGYMGFDMKGVIQAYGLMQGAAEGANQDFPCPCTTDSARSSALPRASQSSVPSDDEVVNALKQIAERRRLERVKQHRSQ